MAFSTYAGFEVFDIQPLKPANQSFTLRYLVLGKDMQVRKKYVFEGERDRFEYEYLLKDLGEIATFRDFFRRKKGKLTPFWIKSGKRDYKLIQSAPTNSQTLVVEKSYLEYTFPFRRHIYIPYLDHYARITSVQDNPDNQTLVIDSPLPADLPAGETIMNLYLVRFDTDTLVFEFRDRNVAFVKLSFVELQEETP